mmetsp:Transcript_28505/g.67929  ORF Transcript_28505/g.67929 Transcript_28505/m.67929 type:complete len:371 (+) Transcript_28505:4679-5791(+)
MQGSSMEASGAVSDVPSCVVLSCRLVDRICTMTFIAGAAWASSSSAPDATASPSSSSSGIGFGCWPASPPVRASGPFCCRRFSWTQAAPGGMLRGSPKLDCATWRTSWNSLSVSVALTSGTVICIEMLGAEPSSPWRSRLISERKPSPWNRTMSVDCMLPAMVLVFTPETDTSAVSIRAMPPPAVSSHAMELLSLRCPRSTWMESGLKLLSGIVMTGACMSMSSRSSMAPGFLAAAPGGRLSPKESSLPLSALSRLWLAPEADHPRSWDSRWRLLCLLRDFALFRTGGAPSAGGWRASIPLRYPISSWTWRLRKTISTALSLALSHEKSALGGTRPSVGAWWPALNMEYCSSIRLLESLSGRRSQIELCR